LGRLTDGLFSIGAISHSFSAYISKNVAETKSYIIFERTEQAKGISEEGENSKSQRRDGRGLWWSRTEAASLTM
jgi:hypothetical protein